MLEFGIFDWIEAGAAPAAKIYEHKLSMAEAADKAGFYAWHLAEHQGTPLSINASPSVILAAAIQRTSRLRLGALTFCLPWYNPYRLYHEVCMLDQLSGGRLELGVGRGVSPIESLIFHMKSIEESRSRYRETLDIFFAACRNPVLNYEGEYYSYRDVELYNKPVQKPYPPLWFPSSNRESIDFTARHGYNTVLICPMEATRGLFERYREVCEKHRNDLDRHNAHVPMPFLGKTQHIVLADTEKEAMDAGLAAYEAWKGHMHHLTRKHGKPEAMPLDPFAKHSVQRLIAGTPKSVIPQLRELVRETGINYLLVILSFGNLAPERAMRSLELFARDVMPALRA